jgi:peptidoglycan/xylan/chitin deacetylase (PgdA/CDA1 family)
VLGVLLGALACSPEKGSPAVVSGASARVTPWRAGADAAYSIIHDDFCDWTTFGLQDYAVPELEERGLRAGFGAIAARCAERNFWPVFDRVVGSGQEIINHSMTHARLTDVGTDLAMEIDGAAQLIADNVPGVRIEFFIFPFDAFDDRSIEHLRASGYLGARAGVRGWNGSEVEDPLRLAFDAYGPAYSLYEPDVTAGRVTDILGQYVEDALERGAWAIRELHGVEDNSWEPVPLEEYRAHLDQVAAHVATGRLWMDVPGTITRYVQSRRLCGTPEATGTRLTWRGRAAECAKFKAPLTVELQSERGLVGLRARQGERELETRSVNAQRVLVLDVDPDLDVALEWGADAQP